MTRFRRAGWKVLFFPGAEVVHVGGASHGGQLYVENLRGHLRFFASTAGRRRPSACARLLLSSLRLRALVAAPRGVPRGRPLPLVRQRQHTARCSDRVPPTRVRHACVVLPGWAVARALGQRSVVGGARVDDGARSSSRGPSCSRCTRTSSSRSLLLAADLRRRARRGSKARVPGTRRRTWFAVVARRRRRARLAPLARRRAPSSATASSTRRACASSSTSATCTCARSTSSRTAGCTPATRSRSGTGFVALVAWFSGLDPAVVVRHEPSLLAPIAVRGRVGGGRRRLRLARRRRRRSRSRTLALFCFAPGARRLVRDARAARRPRRASCSCRPRSRSSSPRRLRRRRSSCSARSRSSTPTYALFMLVPLRRRSRAREWRAYARSRPCPVAAGAALAAPARRTRRSRTTRATCERLRGARSSTQTSW